MKALAVVGRIFSGDGLRSELAQMTRNRDYWRETAEHAQAEYRQAMEWNVCQIENVAEGMRYAGVLREALAGMLEASCVGEACNDPAHVAARVALGLP